MDLQNYLKLLSEEELDDEVVIHYVDYKENQEHLIHTYKYYMENPQKISQLYKDMGYTGHNIFEDAIRFKFLKLVECFKKVSNIMRKKFYGDIKNIKDAYNIMNKDIFDEDEDRINYLQNLINNRNSIAHETDSYELFVFENESEDLKIDIDFLTVSFLSLICYYEERENIKIIKDEKWTFICSESDFK